MIKMKKIITILIISLFIIGTEVGIEVKAQNVIDSGANGEKDNGNSGCEIGDIPGHKGNQHKIDYMTKDEWNLFLKQNDFHAEKISNNDQSNGWITYHVYNNEHKQIEVVHIKFKQTITDMIPINPSKPIPTPIPPSIIVPSNPIEKFEYDVTLTPIEKIVKLDEIVDIIYTVVEKDNKISKEKLTLYIDMPYTVELQDFKVNGKDVEIQIDDIGNYNRLTFSYIYEESMTFEYSVKILESFKDTKSYLINHATRNEETGEHINGWMHTKLMRFEDVLDGSENDNISINPPATSDEEEDQLPNIEVIPDEDCQEDIEHIKPIEPSTSDNQDNANNNSDKELPYTGGVDSISMILLGSLLMLGGYKLIKK